MENVQSHVQNNKIDLCQTKPLENISIIHLEAFSLQLLGITIIISLDKRSF